VAHFDRAISPGGEGKVTLTIDLKGIQGPVWKTAHLISNDPQNPSVSLRLHGKVRPLIECRPSCFIQFNGNEAVQSPKTIDLIATSTPFQIKRIENSLKEKISFQLHIITPGRHYQLRVINRQKTEKFSGNLKCLTDQPKKPEIQSPVYNNLNG
jgi:hypothetical protein